MENRGNIDQKDLPYDLIMQNILTRLPIKRLIRFKSASKLWNSTISSPHFAQTHFNFPSPSPTESLLLRSETKFHFLSRENDEINMVNIDIDFDVGNENLVLVGSRNGLVCLGSTSGCLFILWNPITREFRKYLDYEISDFHTLDCMVTWGFGYVSSVDDYKIIRICKKTFKTSFRVHVFSTRRDKWRRIDDDSSSHNFSYLRIAERLYKPAVLLNETLYWMGGLPIVTSIKRKILSFDLSLDLFTMFPHLDVSTPSTWKRETDDDQCLDEFLTVMNGCLSKYGRFVKIHVDVNLVPSLCRNSLIGFTQSDRFRAQYQCGDQTRLGIVDPSSRPMNQTALMSFKRGTEIEFASYSATLISPPAVTRKLEDPKL